MGFNTDSHFMYTAAPISCNQIISDRNIWRSSSCAVSVWIIFGYADDDNDDNDDKDKDDNDDDAFVVL